MFGLGAATRIYLAPGATDMRKGFEGLYGLVRDRLECDPLSGHVFVFANARRNRLKLIFWDEERAMGVREEFGRGVSLAEGGEAAGEVVLSHEELAMLSGRHRSGAGTRRRMVSQTVGRGTTKSRIAA